MITPLRVSSRFAMNNMRAGVMSRRAFAAGKEI